MQHKLARTFYYTSIVSYCCSFILFCLKYLIFADKWATYNQFPLIKWLFALGAISASILNLTSLRKHLKKPDTPITEKDKEMIRKMIHEMLD